MLAAFSARMVSLPELIWPRGTRKRRLCHGPISASWDATERGKPDRSMSAWATQERAQKTPQTTAKPQNYSRNQARRYRSKGSPDEPSTIPTTFLSGLKPLGSADSKNLRELRVGCQAPEANQAFAPKCSTFEYPKWWPLRLPLNHHQITRGEFGDPNQSADPDRVGRARAIGVIAQ